MLGAWVTTAISGSAIAQSAAICPGPRIPISVTRTSVSGSSLQTVSGRPISLLRLFSAQIVETCVAHSAPRTSLVVSFLPSRRRRRAPGSDRRSDASATSAASWSSGSAVAAPWPLRRRT